MFPVQTHTTSVLQITGARIKLNINVTSELHTKTFGKPCAEIRGNVSFHFEAFFMKTGRMEYFMQRLGPSICDLESDVSVNGSMKLCNGISVFTASIWCQYRVLWAILALLESHHVEDLGIDGRIILCGI
jgi:hypothetical protein